MSEPITVTTSSFVMPSPTQLIIGGVALGIGLTAGYGLACWTAELVNSGLDKSGIKDRVASLMGSDEEEVEAELEEEVEDELEVDEEDEVEDEDEDEEEDELEEEEQVEAVKQSAKKAREKAAV